MGARELHYRESSQETDLMIPRRDLETRKRWLAYVEDHEIKA